MDNKKRVLSCLALVLALLVFWGLARGVWRVQENGQLTITALSIGKADALIVQQGRHTVVIDTGEEDDGADLLKELKSRGVTKVDLLLVTHFDKDHVGGAAYLADHMEISSVMMPEYEGGRPEYRAFLESLQGHAGVRRVATPEQLAVGDMQFSIYPAEDPDEIMDTEDEYDNDMSLVASLTFGSGKFLFAGDIEGTRIQKMLSTGIDWRHDWLKLPHHGRYEDALIDLLDAVDPDTVVICCSEKNPAEKKTLKLLEEKQVEVWDTSRRAVVTRSDGKQITVTTE